MSESLSGSLAVTSDTRHAGPELLLQGEQLAAVTTVGEVVALSAGAGSGKTTVLVERFLNFVTRDGVSPQSILAITYTEKAAAEMKERIIRRFEESGDDDNRRRAESAYISTIHGFCARLLRENPIAAGIDPSFGLVDDMQRGLFLDEERDRLFADEWFLEIRGLFPSRRQSRHDRLFGLIEDCVLKAREFGKGVPAEQSWDIDQHVAAAMDRLDQYCDASWKRARSALMGVASEIIEAAVSGPQSMIQHRRLCEMITELKELGTCDATWAGEFIKLTGFTRGVKDIGVRTAIKDAITPARAILKKLAGIDRIAEEELERDQIAPIKVAIYKRACELRANYEQMKRERSLLDFDDLQRFALDLLRQEGVCAEYASRFRHILVDEVQDINPLQKAIIDALRCGSGQCLFAVGDIKQSVYGFRGADVSLFSEMHRAAGDGKLQLRDNYRSRPEIIDFVNAVGELMWRNNDLIEYVPLVGKFDYRNAAIPMAPAIARVELALVEKRPADPGAGREKADNSAIVHEREALGIAIRIRRIVDGGDGLAPLTMYDRHSKEYRRARYGDIAILTRSRTHFPTYERVLADLGIPVIADGGRGFFNGREVQDLLAALRVIANPYDEIALLATLRSPLFGWSDEDLVLLRSEAPRDLWRAVRCGFQPRGPFADPAAYQTLAALRRLRETLAPVQLIQMLLDRTAYIAALLRTPRGRTAVANVQKLLEFTRRSMDTDGPDLRRFIQRAELAKDYLAMERETVGTVEGEEVVQMGTIHGSKGLEWPVVILAGLEPRVGRQGGGGGSFYSAPDEALIIEPHGENETPCKPVSQQLVIDATKSRDEQEGLRLFYVGMTRAREYLILTGENALSDDEAPGDSADEARVTRAVGAPIKWLCAAAGVTAVSSEGQDASIGRAEVRVSLITEAAVAPLRGLVATGEPELAAARRAVARGEVVSWEAPAAERQIHIEATVRRLLSQSSAASVPQGKRPVTTVTQLVYFARCPLVYYFSLVLKIEEHPRKRRSAEVVGDHQHSAVELGTAVHEMLERADFNNEPKAEAHRLIGDGNNYFMRQLDGVRGERVEHMLANVLSDPLIDRARRATRLEREYPFFLSMSGTMVHGVIDLVFTDANGRSVVVDYKSNDLAAPDRVNVLSRYYEPQIKMYALAASRAGFVQSEEAILYFLNKSIARTFEINTADLEVVEQEMNNSLSRISRADWDTEPGEKCRHCGYRTRDFCEVGRRFVE